MRFAEGLATLAWIGFIAVACLRLLTPEEYGHLTWALWLMAVLGSAAHLGLPERAAMQIAAKRDEAWRYFTNFTVLRGVLGIAVVVLALAWSALPVADTPAGKAVLPAGIYGVCIGLVALQSVFLRAFGAIRYAAWSRVSQRLLTALPGLAGLVLFGTASATAWGMALGSMAAAAFAGWLVAFRVAPFDRHVVSVAFLKDEIRSAAGFALLAIATIAWLRIPLLIAAPFAGETALGHLSAGLRVIEAAVLLMALAFRSAGDSVVVLVSMAAGALLLVAAPSVVQVLAGSRADAYLSGGAGSVGTASLLRLLAPALAALCLTSRLSQALMEREGPDFLTRFMPLATLATGVLLFAAALTGSMQAIAGTVSLAAVAIAAGLWVRSRQPLPAPA